MYNAPNIGPAGLSIPSYTDILNDNLNQFLNIFGQNQYVGTDSAIYQLLAILSLKTSDVLKALQFAYNQMSPLTAVGAGLDRCVKYNGIARSPFGYSTATLTITGVPGATITNGIAQDVNGNQWALPTVVVIPGPGTINVIGTCIVGGNITASANTINVIATPQAGWSTVNNPSDAIPGNSIETDSQLRARQAISVALPSETLLAGTVADLAALAGVTRYNVLENPTNAIDAYGNPPHSLTAVVEGGTNDDVAQTIYNNRGIGCYTNGTTQVIVTDPNTGYTMPINFDRPTYFPIYVSLSVQLLAGGTTATLDSIQAAIVNYLNSLQIGQSVIYSELYGAALEARPNPDMPLFSIKALTCGTTPAPTGTMDIPMLFYQVASGLNPNVVVTSV